MRECTRRSSNEFLIKQFGMEVQLKTKLVMFSPHQKIQKRRMTLRKTMTSAASVEDYLHQMESRGWVVEPYRLTPTLPKFIKCKTCRSPGCRKYFSRQQWSSDEPECKSCCKRKVDIEKCIRVATRRQVVEEFVSPTPREPVFVPPVSGGKGRFARHPSGFFEQCPPCPQPPSFEQFLVKQRVGRPLEIETFNWMGTGKFNRFWRELRGHVVTAFAFVGTAVRITCDLCASDGHWWVQRHDLEPLMLRRVTLPAKQARCRQCPNQWCVEPEGGRVDME